MPTFQFRCIFNCWAIISLIFAFRGDLYLFAQEREGGQGQIIKQQQEAEQLSQDSLSVQIIPDSLLEGVKLYRYEPKFGAAKLYAPRVGALYSSPSTIWDIGVRWDTISTYTIHNYWYNIDLAPKTIVDFEDFISLKMEQNELLIRHQLIREAKAQQEESRGLLDFRISVPGGENSAFTTIFGTDEVSLRVNGSANMNVGASIQKLDDGTLPEDLRTRVDPTFNQNLQLNIQGNIGDKLTIATDWDTERQFDFQNRLSIVYEGYEDEIIKSIEMGNVSMETGNSLVSGGKSLFGIKAISELGPLKLTSVVSQQKGTSNSQKISGGSQEQAIDITPADYEDGRHFFLDFYNRQQFEQALVDPQNILQPYQISELYVYVRRSEQIPGESAVQAIALLDLGVNQMNDKLYGLPGNDRDRYDESTLNELRATNSNATNDDFGATAQEYVDAPFELLQEGIDYTFNRALGFISMKSYINTGDAVAVAYVYNDPEQGGAPVAVGELNASGNDRIYLKLLRPGGMTTADKAWNLTMRNIYSLGVSGINPEGFELEIADTRGNIPEVNLPGRSATLLQDLGLDRVNSEGATIPDNQIDFTGITLDAGTGRIMFPYLEPFGKRIDEILGNSVSDSVRQSLTFKELYKLKQSDARDISKNRNYTISGNSKGGVSGSFYLGFGLIEGSVKVFANNVELIEGSDFEVDYSFGSLTIMNESYLAPGQEIEVEYESNQFSIIGQKNFTGLRAEYRINDDIQFGSTFFKLKEQPLSDKIRIGNEPINNTVLGLDARANFEAPWLTQAIDKVPLLQTKTPSNIQFSGEFAQLRPGVAQTNAVQEAIDNNELYRDEENGLVFIDDFEGAEYTISLTNPTRWNLASAPAALPGYGPDETYFANPDFTTPQSSFDRKARADLRSQFSWYSIPRNISSIRNAIVTPESETILLKDVFQGRETNNRQEDVISSLDMHFNPAKRGPYNYNLDLKNVLENNPENTWGGMTYVIPSGQEDLVQNNIEFLEFWVQAILPGGQDPTGEEPFYDGKIYLDLGIISEDVIPNVRLNTEDGLSTVLNNLQEDDAESQPRSYIPPSPPVPLGQFSNDKRVLEDVGLDGAPNPGTQGAENRDEGALFSDFIEAMRAQYGEGTKEFSMIEEDPSNDDYVYYGENKVLDYKLHERFFRMLGHHDGNTPESGGSDNKTAVTLKPDTEGLVSASSIQQTNSYYQYEIDFNPADVSQLNIGSPGTYIVDKIPRNPEYKTWYLVRVPLNDFKRKFGDIESFQNISYIRMWMSGYQKPFTMRFATLEFVGSQWRKVSNLSDSPVNPDDFKLSTINIEENANREPFPYRQPDGAIRALNRSAQIQALENEQSLVLSVENLEAGMIQMVKRVYPGKLNLLNYSNMRMFVHGEGFYERGDAELVVRLGTDLDNNYYEYRQPVSPSQPMPFNYNPSDAGQLEVEAAEIWRYDENNMNIIISAFNVLKQLRDDAGADPTEVFEQKGILDPEKAVNGAVVAIKGNPSLDRVTEIGLGIRNPYNPQNINSSGSPLLNAEMWLNELRLSGFDNEKGWAANAKSTIKFADFATVNANLTRRTNGFGGLESRLGDRSVSDQTAYGISSTINLHKLIPDRFGWSFPVTISNRVNSQIPKYLPSQGDIRLTDFIDKVNADDLVPSDLKDDVINSKINDIESINETFSFNVSNISKRNSKPKLAQLTLDNTKLSYVYNEGYSKNPQLVFQNKWDYKASIQYNLSLRRIKLLQLFKFTSGIPVLGALSELRFGYLPSSITASSTLTRRYDESRRRNLIDPEDLQALQQSHAFTQQNRFSFSYNFMPSIPITFTSSSNFDFSSLGINPSYRDDVDSLSYSIKPSFDVIKGAIRDSLTPRRSSYQESYSASWRPKLNAIDALNWLTYSASYGGGYQWTNSPSGSDLGANVSNSFQLDNTFKVSTSRLLDKFDWYKMVEEANKNETKLRRDAKEKLKEEIDSGLADSLRTPKPPPDLVKDMQFISRKVLLTLLSLEDVSIGYKRQKSGSQPGYSGSSEFFKSFNDKSTDDYSPSFAYRLGLKERIPKQQLIGNEGGDNNIQLPANNTQGDNFSASTRISPFENITVNLDWDATISQKSTETITLTPINEITSIGTESGSFSSSVWAFGGGYKDLFESQLETAVLDIRPGERSIVDSLGNSDGRGVLNRTTLQEDYMNAYLGAGSKGFGNKGFMAFPKPGWRVTWNRLEKYIPFIGKYMTNASLNHAYRGSYKVDWSLNALVGEQSGQNIGDYSIIDVRGRYEPTSIRAERRFSPFVKLNMNWESGLKTDIGYDRSTISTFAVSSKRVTETLTQGVDASVNYIFRNVRISFLPKLRNNIDMSLRGSYKNDTEISYKLDTDLDNALQNGVTMDQIGSAETLSARETGQRRINGSFTLGYKISSTVSSNFEYTYSRIESNNIPTRTNHDIRFNFRIAIRSR